MIGIIEVYLTICLITVTALPTYVIFHHYLRLPLYFSIVVVGLITLVIVKLVMSIAV